MLHQDFSWQTKDGLKIFGQEWKPEGKVKAAIALVHGLGEHAGRYQHVAEYFTSKGHSITAFDLRGHGKSEGVRGHAVSYEALMEDISHNIELARQHFPGVPVFLYGHSLGGNLVLCYCLTQKPDIQGAIVTSPGLGTAEPVPAVKLFLGKLMYKLAPATQMENDLDRSGLSRDPEVEKIYSADPLVHGKISARWALDMLNNGQYILAHAGEFPVPLLLMVGSADRLISVPLVRKLALDIPVSKLTFKEWDGYYHELHNEPEKTDVLNTMTNWIATEIS